MKKNSFTYKLDEAQFEKMLRVLRSGNYRPVQVPHTAYAVEAADCRINLYNSKKCLIQGKGAEDFVMYVLEPQILQEAQLGYEDIRHPDQVQPHMGIDESGKGDFFGPMVIAAVYVDESIVNEFRKTNVRDSKTIKSDQVMLDMARSIREIVRGRSSLVTIGPEAYNRLYTKMRSVNTLLAWGHARAIENLLEIVPACPRALSDQFGPTRQIQQALLKQGRRIELQQMHRAESDPAVAAASILARAGFLHALKKMEQQYGLPIPKGASATVRETAGEFIKKHSAEELVKVAKCHFKTTDEVLAAQSLNRDALGPLGQAVSKPYKRPQR